jgi:import inner membrane translocase subunit TIM9
MSRHHKAEELFIPELMISPEDTDNKEFRRCFKLCVKDLTVSYLDQKEAECSCNHLNNTENCLTKYFDASHFLSQK